MDKYIIPNDPTNSNYMPKSEFCKQCSDKSIKKCSKCPLNYIEDSDVNSE